MRRFDFLITEDEIEKILSLAPRERFRPRWVHPNFQADSVASGILTRMKVEESESLFKGQAEPEGSHKQSEGTCEGEALTEGTTCCEERGEETEKVGCPIS